MAYLSHIQTALPDFRYDQSELATYMARAYNGDEDFNRKLDLIYARSGINTRYSCLPDFREELEFSSGFGPYGRKNFAVESGSGPEVLEAPMLSRGWNTGVAERMQVFAREAPALSMRAIEPLLEDFPKEQISHLLTVSCTGMAAPGLDLWLMQELELAPSVQRSSVNFMGCYAAIHGLKHAAAIADSEEDAHVLLVCTELCTLHFRGDPAWEQVTAISIFSDGSAACIVSSKKQACSASRILGFYSEVHAEGENDMAWHIEEQAFRMDLSNAIPDLLGQNIASFLEKAKQKASIPQVDSWCFHPGGRKILDYIQQHLGLQRDDLRASYEVLENCGNMSSASVLFSHKLCDARMQSGDICFSAAFGPGITLESFFTQQV